MKRSKHGLFVFPPKRTLIRRRHCSISQSCRSMTSKRFLESSSGMTFFQPSFRLTNQKRRAFVSVRQTNQIALFPFVCCFCFVRKFSFQGHTKIALNKLLDISVKWKSLNKESNCTLIYTIDLTFYFIFVVVKGDCRASASKQIPMSEGTHPVRLAII